MAIIRYIFLMGVPLIFTIGLYQLLDQNEAVLEGIGDIWFLYKGRFNVCGSIAAFVILLYVSFEIYKKGEVKNEARKVLRRFRRDLDALKEIIEEHDRQQGQIDGIVGRYDYKANYEEDGTPKEAEGARPSPDSLPAFSEGLFQRTKIRLEVLMAAHGCPVDWPPHLVIAQRHDISW